MDFYSTLSLVFSSSEYANAFVFGMVFTCWVLVICNVVPNVVNFIIELIRCVVFRSGHA